LSLDWIKLLYDYNGWANSRIFGAVSKLDAEKYVMDLKSSYKSVRDTMVHIICVEWIWFKRLKGTSPKAFWTPADIPTIPELKLRWEYIVRNQNEFIRSIKEESLNIPTTYQNTKGETFTYPLWQILMHAVNHSSYHRGQITTMLRQLGAQAVPLDLFVFIDLQKEEIKNI
jgi:uncharacterized damage-inducible protein DinB